MRRREEWASTGTGTTERRGSLGCAGGKCGGEVSRQKYHTYKVGLYPESTGDHPRS